MLPHEKAMLLNAQLAPRQSKLVYPPQNLIDLIWKSKPARSKEQVYVHGMEFTGKFMLSLSASYNTYQSRQAEMRLKSSRT